MKATWRALGIETSGRACRVALLGIRGRPSTFAEAVMGGRFEEREYSGDAARHSEVIYGLLDEVLGRVRGAVRELSVVAVSLGPGSFTGLRVGLSVAKVITQFGRIPLAGVPTLEAMAAEEASASGAPFVVATLDARRGEVYTAGFRWKGGSTRPAGKPRICLPDEALRGAPAGTRVVSDPPRAASIAALGLLRFLAGKRDDPRTLVPVYVRRPEAVEKLRRGLLPQLPRRWK